jgi:hypothetical protein
VDEFWKQLVTQKCDQKFEEAAECRMYDKMTSDQIKNAGSVNAFSTAQTWAIDFRSREGQRTLGGCVVG